MISSQSKSKVHFLKNDLEGWGIHFLMSPLHRLMNKCTRFVCFQEGLPEKCNARLFKSVGYLN